MPATPLHIGIPGLLSLYRPKRVDIVSGVLGSVLIDVDFFLFLLVGAALHGYCHTLVGATLISVFLIIIIQSTQKYVIRIKKWFGWEQESSIRSVSFGAFLGAYSHVILDALIYEDVKPCYPRDGNPLYLENGHDTVFMLVYGIAGISTFLLLALYCWKYYRNVGADPIEQ